LDTLVTLTVEVQNGYEHPAEMDDLAEQLHSTEGRLENTTDFTPEDEFLSQAFEFGYEGLESNEEYYVNVVKELSSEYPPLVFLLEGKTEDGSWLRYFKAGVASFEAL
jgi:hypothetical protein